MIYSITSLAILTEASRARVTRYVTKHKTIFKKTVKGNRIMLNTSLEAEDIIQLFKDCKKENHVNNISKYNELRKSHKL